MLTAPSGTCGAIEIEFAAGARMRITGAVDATTLSAVVLIRRALRAACPANIGAHRSGSMRATLEEQLLTASLTDTFHESPLLVQKLIALSTSSATVKLLDTRPMRSCCSQWLQCIETVYGAVTDFHAPLQNGLVGYDKGALKGI
ncbi:hypothetical protein ABIE89_002134 [Bradyrhizobium niftali]|uniref:hypothetical protein n=1 Tax=Bradyrhizobium niftali TaxID=2560055 RepID=UPI0038331219